METRKVKLGYVGRKKDKNGNDYLNVGIQTNAGMKWASAWTRDWNTLPKWRKGQTVDVGVEVRGEFVNLKPLTNGATEAPAPSGGGDNMKQLANITLILAEIKAALTALDQKIDSMMGAGSFEPPEELPPPPEEENQDGGSQIPF